MGLQFMKWSLFWRDNRIWTTKPENNFAANHGQTISHWFNVIELPIWQRKYSFEDGISAETFYWACPQTVLKLGLNIQNPVKILSCLQLGILGGASNTRIPLSPNSFIFMQVCYKNYVKY